MGPDTEDEWVTVTFNEFNKSLDFKPLIKKKLCSWVFVNSVSQ